MHIISLFKYFTALGAGILVQAQAPAEDDEQPQHLTNDGKWLLCTLFTTDIHNFNY